MTVKRDHATGRGGGKVGRSPLHLVHICIVWYTVNSGVCPGQAGSVYLLATSARCLLHTGVQETLKDPWENVE